MPVVGAGTGTSDSVPVVVAGQDVRLSNGEGAAILPARTMRNPAAVQAVEGIIEATNGKPPVKGARGLAYGGILGQQNQTESSRSLAHREQLHADGLRAIHRDSCHCSSDFSGDSTRFRAASSSPDADDEHHQEREQLFGGAAFAIFAGVDVARSAGARATGWPGDSSPADRATFSDAGHADYRRLRQQSGADTAVSETTR